jgi:uncharacterized membrane protein (Fun14 family)
MVMIKLMVTKYNLKKTVKIFSKIVGFLVVSFILKKSKPIINDENKLK